MSEPNEVLREEELIAVQSIYGDDWHDIPPVKTAWGTDVEAGWWGVTVRAEEGRVSVQVRGRLNKKYPDQPPYLKLHEPIGLTGDHVRTLLKLLQDKARSLIGQVMIYELASFAEMWIADNHAPMPKAGEPQRTLMEERALREEAQRAAEEAQSQAAYEKSLLDAAEQNRLLSQKIQLDSDLKKERKEKAVLQELERRRKQSLEALADGELSSRELTLDEPISVKGFDGQWATWCLYNGRKGMLWTTYDAEPIIKDGSMDPHFVRTNLPAVEVQIIDFSKPFYSSDQGIKRIDSLVSEIKRLHEIRSDHVTQVLGVRRDKSPRGWERVIILVERPKGVMLLRDWLPSGGFDEGTAKQYYAQVMSGLTAIHRHNGTQRLFDSNFVTIHRPPNSQHVVKLLGTAYAKRIIDLHKSNPFLKEFHEINPPEWESLDERNHPHDYTAKRDIWNSAILFVELLFGSQANWTYRGLPYLRENRSISPSLDSLLRSILTDQAKKRPTAGEVVDKLAELDMDETRIPERPNINPLPSNGSGRRKSGNGPMSSPNDIHRTFSGGPPLFRQGFEPSRYKADYEEVEKLGQGGFGMVVKARHRFDDNVYAVKKIKLRGDDRRRVTDKEIQILSVLSHPHIVRYFNCWIEDPVKQEGDPDDTESTQTASPAAVDEKSDPFATPDPKNPFAYNSAENSKSLSFPPVRFSLAARPFDEMSSSDEEDDDNGEVNDNVNDESASESETEGDEESGQETESEHPIVKAGKGNYKGKKQDAPPANSSIVTDTTNSDPSAFRTLYIAMAFVNNGTLRELIDSHLSAEESWRLFKEVLDALSYLHSRKVVHRDLKPSNILINDKKQAIVADFGLSTFSAATVETVDPAQAGSISMTKTSNIGTAAYIAPEVMSGRSYDEKADLYSLGVIFFEMSFPPMMGHERAQIINGIRNPTIQFPASWPVGQEKQHDMIRWLLAHDPTSRPSAEVALGSPLIPLELKTPAEYHKAIADLTADRDSDRFKQLLKSVFEPAQSGPVDWVDERASNWIYDHDHKEENEVTEVWSAVIVRRLKDLFHRHGAQETYLPPLVPETKLLDSIPSNKPVRLLDDRGRLVQLIGRNLIAMARSAPKRRVGRRKRFHLGMEYSRADDTETPGTPRSKQPIKSAHLSFDIVSPLRSAAAEVEMIEVVDKVIAEFRGGKSASGDSGYEFYINHESVLSAILDLVPSANRSMVLIVFRMIGVDFSHEKAKEKVKSELKNIGLPRPVINSLEACLIAGDFHEIRPKLELVFASAGPSSRDRLRRALDELAGIVKLLGCISIGRKILFRPTLAHNAELFRGGFMFECNRKNKRRDVLAYGGRYDALLEHFDGGRSHNDPTYGVGMSISVDHLAKMVSSYESDLAKDLMAREKEEERSFGYWTPSRCDVYVAAGVQVDLSVRVKMIAELWRNGISADLQYDDDRTLEDLTTECEDQSTPFLVLPRANRSEVKIRSILRKSEEEVSRNDLCTHLRTLITEQKRIDATYASAEGSIPSSQAAVHLVEPRQEHKVDIRLILPPEPQTGKGTKGRPVRKHRHGTKTVYYEKAHGFALSTKSPLPIIGIDLPLPLLSHLSLHPEWVQDDEPWKSILGGLATSERKYADQVREGVRKLVKDDGCGVFWLFGVREGRGFLMQVR